MASISILLSTTEWILVYSILLGNGFILLVLLLQRGQCTITEIYLTIRASLLRRKCYALVVCLILWLFGLLMGVLYPDNSGESWKLAHNLLMNIVDFIQPVVVIISCSCNIIRALRKRRESVYIEDRNYRKATVLVCAVMLLFLVCWSRFQLFTLLDILCEVEVLDKMWDHTLDIGTQLSMYLAFLNSSLNPVLYVFSGQYFRTTAKDLVKMPEETGTKVSISTVKREISQLK
uniref:Bradykinin receptor B1 n=1 Tax=Hucho hucho TaxID=62062 RepID=A0A4W5P1A3_9TELE